MNTINLYIIEYKLQEQPKRSSSELPVSAVLMHGTGQAVTRVLRPSPSRVAAPLKKFSKPMAERQSITEVRWRKSAAIAWTEAATS